jgi:tetratricopeptide (TPR) repeat protein
MLSLVGKQEETCVLWCHLVEKRPDRMEGLVEQLLDYCRTRVEGCDSVVAQVDREVGADASKRFLAYVQLLLQSVPRLVLYLDNLESLMVGPAEDDSQPPRADAFAQWQPPEVGLVWKALWRLARDSGKLYLVASSRYCHADFAADRLPVSPLTDDALFRMMEWFPGLRRLSRYSRALLVEPVLPEARGKLWDNLLLKAIWQRILNDRERRMLYRMTLLRRPWTRDLNRLLGEAEEPEATAEATAARLERTSLLELLTQGGDRLTLHPATRQFIAKHFPADEQLRLSTHRRIGEYLERTAKTSPYIETGLEAGFHLFEAGEHDRAYMLLGPASNWLSERGRACETLAILQPFLKEEVLRRMSRRLAGSLLGTVGLAHADLGQVEKAIGYYEQRLVIAREISDRRGEANTLGNLGVAYNRLGQVEKAIGFYEQHLVIAREIGDRQAEGAALGNLGFAYESLGQVEKSVGLLEQAL